MDGKVGVAAGEGTGECFCLKGEARGPRELSPHTWEAAGDLESRSGVCGGDAGLPRSLLLLHLPRRWGPLRTWTGSNDPSQPRRVQNGFEVHREALCRCVSSLRGHTEPRAH